MLLFDVGGVVTVKHGGEKFVDMLVLNLVWSLRRRGIRTGICSNANINKANTLENIYKYFDFPIILSCYVQLQKPDQRMFAICTGFCPDLFIDNRKRNTLVARHCGLPSFTYKPANIKALYNYMNIKMPKLHHRYRPLRLSLLSRCTISKIYS